MTDEPINDKVTVSSPETGASTKQTLKFEDLTSAGRVLATRLEDYSGTNTVVLAIARGGVPVALEVARHLAVPLDIILIRRLLANGPGSQICAVNIGGNMIIDQGLALPPDSPKTPFEYFVIDALAGLTQRETRVVVPSRRWKLKERKCSLLTMVFIQAQPCSRQYERCAK